MTPRMIPTNSHLALAAILSITLWAGASAQSTSNCMSTILSLAPCLNYITGNASTPTSSCCSQLATVVKSKPICLCAVLKDGVPSLGITINRTQALQLPVDCKVKTPPVSRCNDLGVGPATSPSPGSSISAGALTGPSAAAAAAGPTSDGNYAQTPIFLVISSLVIAVYTVKLAALCVA